MLMDGYTNREIGEMFGVPANHVTAWVSRARKVLSEAEYAVLCLPKPASHY